jgi:hypothetical protein
VKHNVLKIINIYETLLQNIFVRSFIMSERIGISISVPQDVLQYVENLKKQLKCSRSYAVSRLLMLAQCLGKKDAGTPPLRQLQRNHEMIQHCYLSFGNSGYPNCALRLWKIYQGCSLSSIT